MNTNNSYIHDMKHFVISLVIDQWHAANKKVPVFRKNCMNFNIQKL